MKTFCVPVSDRYSKQITEETFSGEKVVLKNDIRQWFPTFFDAFLPLLIFFYSTPGRVRKLVLTTSGTMVLLAAIT